MKPFSHAWAKKPSFTIGSENVFEVSATRPLSVVNTDNRILANALRLTITPKAETWVSPQQRGFISGRYLLANVVDIDFEAMRVSLSHSRGVLVLFDFRAAFPSLAHDYLWKVLEKLGMPPPLIRALRCFYVNNVHTMKLKGRRFPSITSQSGIRQGCPLSPLLFAIVVDLFLRRLDTLFPHECTRAFADDIAMVLHNFDSSADLLMSEFRKFGAISGLHLGMSKTILIPLWTFDERSFKGFLRDTFPAWSTAQVKTCGKYLGFMLGPGKRDSSWTDVLEKYRSRSVVWSGPPVGLFRATQIYKTFVFSVLAFVCQLEEPPEAAILLESICMRKFAPGPGNWISALDLFHLQDLFGLPVSFPSIRTYALASKLRVARFEIGDIHAKSRELTALLSNTVVKPVPHDWYERSCIRLLAAAVSQAEALRVTHALITQALKAKTSLSGAKLSAFIRIHYQKEAYKQLLSKGCDGLDVERRHRHEQSRWALQAYPGMAARWAASLFRRLASLVRPRVISSIARTHWNAW